MVGQKLLQNKHFKYGVPFLIAVIGGSFGLQFYSQLRYDVYKQRHIITKTQALREAIGANKKPTTIEEEYEDYKKNVDIDNWKNIRGPRPWDETSHIKK